MELKCILLIGLVTLSPITSISYADKSCDCKIFPFEPTPPCFKICYVGAAAKASTMSLQKVLGINEDLATKISNLDEVGVLLSSTAGIWQHRDLEGSNIQYSNGKNLGQLVGFYKSPFTNQIHFAAQNTQTDSLVGIPIMGTTYSEHAILVQPHTPIYYAVDQPTQYGERIIIRNIPLWTQNQLNKAELEILSEKMKKLSPDEFIELIHN